MNCPLPGEGLLSKVGGLKLASSALVGQGQQGGLGPVCLCALVLCALTSAPAPAAAK